MNYVFNFNLPASSGTIGTIASVAIPWLSTFAKKLLGGEKAKDSAVQTDEKKVAKEQAYNKRSLIIWIVLTLAGLCFAALIYFKGDTITLHIPAFMQGVTFPSLGNLTQDIWVSVYAAMIILFLMTAVYAIFLGFKNKIISASILAIFRLFWSSMPLLLVFVLFGLDPFIGAAISFATIAIFDIVMRERIYNLKERRKEKKSAYYNCQDLQEKAGIDKERENLYSRLIKERIFFNSFTLVMYILAFIFIFLQIISNNIIPVFFSKAFWKSSFNSSDFTFLETCLQQFVFAFLLSLINRIRVLSIVISKVKAEKTKLKKSYHIVYFLRFTFYQILLFGTIGSLIMQLLKIFVLTSMASIGVALLVYNALGKCAKFEERLKERRKDRKAEELAEQS